MNKLPQAVIEQLGNYVYLYINPFDGKIFYVSKGQDDRVLSHLDDEKESKKTEIIQTIRELGKEPKIDILVHGLKSDDEALDIEASAIDLLGVDNLANEKRGYRSNIVGRAPLAELIALYKSEKVEVDDPVILIRINRLYRFDMTENELYEATRGVWRIGKRREDAKYTLAVLRSIVREVYEIEHWYPAGTTNYETRDESEIDKPGRWEFTGQIAHSAIREKYINKSVEDYFPLRAQNPITYVNC